jgi:ABC-2 type transport system permease protein
MTTATLTTTPNTINKRTTTMPIAATAGRAGTLSQIGLLFQWQLRRGLPMIPFLVVVQAMMAVLTVFGYGLLIGSPPPEVAMYLATGAVIVNLIMVGLVITPQGVAESKTEGSLGWMRTLPVPRWVYLASELLLWVLLTLPGTALGLFLGAWHYDVTLSISPWLILAAPLTAFIATTVGYSMALLTPPRVAALITQIIVFVVLMFSPISFPASRLPGWLSAAHRWLPFEPLADLMRATLLSNQFDMPMRSIVVLAVWTVVASIGAMAALSKRT